jgi:O-antigen/teichoic acid export membrane protein
VGYWSLIVAQLFSFQTCHALVKEGSVSAARADFSGLWSVIRFGALLDIAAAIFATAIFTVGVSLTVYLVELESTIRLLLYLSALCIITNISGAPSAVLRLFDKYTMLALHGGLSGFCKLAFTVIAWSLGGNILEFGIAWIAAQVVSNLFLSLLAIVEFRRQRLRNPPMGKILGFRETLTFFPELRSRLISTNLSATLRMVRDLDVPIVAWILGPSAVGLFKIARQVGTAFMKIIDPFFQVTYPDMAALEESGGRRKVVQLLKRSSLVVGAGSVVGFIMFSVFGESIISVSLGREFTASYPAAISCVAGVAIWGFTQSYGAALLVWNRHRALLVLNVFSSVVYLGSLIPLSRFWGVSGAGFSTLLYFAFWGVVAFYLVHREIRGKTTPSSWNRR